MHLRRAAWLAAIMTGLLTPLIAQDPPPIWTGVYTAAQADRGRTVIENHCSECHHADLSGGEGPALMGQSFMVKWEMQSVERLFHKVRDTMPEVGNTDVTHQEKLDSVAFMLQQNGYPAGTVELTDANGALAAIRMEPRDGPGVPRSGALVQAVGCLQKAGSQWTLTQSTEPQVTSRDPLTASEKEAMSTAAPGTRTIELLSVYPTPEQAQGTVLVKGLFINRPAGMRINVTSVELVHLNCGK